MALHTQCLWWGQHTDLVPIPGNTSFKIRLWDGEFDQWVNSLATQVWRTEFQFQNYLMFWQWERVCTIQIAQWEWKEAENSWKLIVQLDWNMPWKSFRKILCKPRLKARTSWCCPLTRAVAFLCITHKYLPHINCEST